MKYVTTAILAVLLVVLRPASTSPYDFRSYGGDLAPMTFNIKGNPAVPGDVDWKDRDGDIVTVIEESNAHVVGLQECWLPWLLTDLEGYMVVGSSLLNVGGNPIIYDPTRLVLIREGSFPLAGNVESFFTGKFLTRTYRQAEWAVFWDSSEERHLFFANVHYDHQSPEERRESTQIIAEKVSVLAGDYPVIILGDFNADATRSEMVSLCDALELTDVCTVLPNTRNEGTLHGFNGEDGEKSWIDHVLVSSELLPEEVETIDDSKAENASDHWPVVVQLGWR